MKKKVHKLTWKSIVNTSEIILSSMSLKLKGRNLISHHRHAQISLLERSKTQITPPSDLFVGEKYSVSTVLHASILTITNTSETIYLLKTQLFYLYNLRIITADQSLSLLVHLTSTIKDLVYIVYIIIASNIYISVH
jgi:hypothetical protein